jgi:hypothetical protein
MGVAWASHALVRRGWLVRGATVHDYHYPGHDVLYSPALVRAYEMEKKEAVHPRVMLDDVAAQAYSAFPILPGGVGDSSAEWLRGLVHTDDDGRPFANYLAMATLPDEEAQSHDRPLEHKRAIESGLSQYSDDPKTIAKYEWAARYHNQFCRGLPEGQDPQGLLIATPGPETR